MSDNKAMSSPVDGYVDAAAGALREGDIQQAALHARKALEAAPEDYRCVHLAATVALYEHRLQDAVRLFEQAVNMAPDDANAATCLNGISRAYRIGGDITRAMETIQQASEKDPHNPFHAIELGYVYTAMGNLDAAIEAYRRALRLDPRNDHAAGMIGNCLVNLGRPEQALPAYEIALAISPTGAEYHFNRGTALHILGRFEEAEQAYREALRHSPDITVYYQLAQVKTFTPDDPDLAAMEARFNAVDGVDTAARIDAGFGLAMALEKSGSHEKAFEFLQKANQAKRSTINYEISQDAQLMARIKSLFTADFIARFGNISKQHAAPIFILGMLRSGSTLVEQILASHSKIRGGGELGLIPPIAGDLGRAWQSRGDAMPGSDAEVKQDLATAAAYYLDRTQHLSDKAERFTDKTLQNFLYAGLISLMFPKATIIHTLRDPRDVCLSCYQRMFTSAVNNFSYDLSELGQYYNLYSDMMSHWHKVLPNRILDVEYENLVENPKKEIRRLLEFCGLEYESDCLEFYKLSRPVNTASSTQIRQPLYKTSVAKWKRYENSLQPLVQALNLEE